MAAKPPARKKPTRAIPVPATEPVGVAYRLVGLEARVKAEARIAAARIEKLEARVERIAAALRRALARDSNPSDSEDE